MTKDILSLIDFQIHATTMIHKITLLAAFSCILIDSCLGSNPSFCDKVNSHDKDEANLGQIFKALSNLNLVTEVKKNSTGPAIKYKVSVCGNASSSDPLSGAVRTSENKDTVLGRVNDTEAILGDSWMLVFFGSGDTTNVSNTTVPHVATVLFLCNETIQGDLQFIQEHSTQLNSNISRCTMEVKTSLVCPPKVVDESSSHAFVFFSIVFFILLAYFLGGALYRRFALGAKGVEQIPHLAFWSQLVENCRMFCCRRRRSSSSSWHGNDDRDDDSLLQP